MPPKKRNAKSIKKTKVSRPFRVAHIVTQIQSIDALVARTASAVCQTLMEQPAFQRMCLTLTPAITFKIKKRLAESFGRLISNDDRKEIAKAITHSLFPLFLSLEMEERLVSNMMPHVERAINAALRS